MKILLVANCHAKPLSIICNTLCTSAEFDWVEVNRLSESDREKVTQKIREADTVLYYPISDRWPQDFVRGGAIRENAKSAFTLTNVYFGGLHPDVTLTGKKPRLQSPLADYHSRTVLMSFLHGLGEKGAFDLIENSQFAEKFGYLNVWSASLAELQKRSNEADIHFYDEFVEMLYERLPLFVVNHPATHLMFIYARKILSHLGLKASSMTSDCFPQWMQAHAIFPVFPYISETFNLPYSVDLLKVPKSETYMSMPEFISRCYAMYRDYNREDMIAMDNYVDWEAKFQAAL